MPAPPAERLKVRCYRCNQLLAVAPTKAGTVVACPKCKADLLIPRPDSRQPSDEPTDPSVVPLKSGTFPALAPVPESATATTAGAGASSSSYLDEIAAVIPPELAALRPEDLRVEAEFFEAITREPPPPPAPADDDPFQFPAELTGRDLFAPPPAETRGNEAPPVANAFSTEVAIGPVVAEAVETPPPLPVAAAVTAPVPAPEKVVLPPIQIETSTIRPPADAQPRAIHQVIVPASVMIAWMMIVLAALPMAFVAGLLIGHFIWKTGP